MQDVLVIVILDYLLYDRYDHFFFEKKLFFR